MVTIGHMATPSPTWPNFTPLESPLRPPLCHISFFTSFRYPWIGFYHSMHCEGEFTSQFHPTFARGHKNGLWPFSAIFCRSCRAWGGNPLLFCCWQTPRHIRRDRFIHVFMQQNRPLAGLECGKNGILPFFWSFLAIWGYIPNPRAPSTSSYPLTLTPTLTVSNSRKILTFEIKEFSFFHDFWCMATPSPI